MNITKLKNRKKYINEIALYHQKEWAHLNNGETLEERKIRMQPYLNDDFIPTMYVAEKNDNLIGTAAIIKCDMDTKPHLSPWMASVFIIPEYRKKGYGSSLVKHIMQEARLNKIDKLYLYTEDADALYEELGWEVITKESFHNQNVIVMETKL
jgi:N-acetylglutamate synthase-like GNAT family acetyltransferase